MNAGIHVYSMRCKESGSCQAHKDYVGFRPLSVDLHMYLHHCMPVPATLLLTN